MALYTNFVKSVDRTLLLLLCDEFESFEVVVKNKKENIRKYLMDAHKFLFKLFELQGNSTY